MTINEQSPLELAINALKNRGKLDGIVGHEEAELVNLVADIIDGVLEGERRDLKQLSRELDHIIRNTPHSCQTEEHCCALHAAHRSAAEKVVERILAMHDAVGRGTESPDLAPLERPTLPVQLEEYRRQLNDYSKLMAAPDCVHGATMPLGKSGITTRSWCFHCGAMGSYKDGNPGPMTWLMPMNAMVEPPEGLLEQKVLQGVSMGTKPPAENEEVTCRGCGRTFVTSVGSPGACVICGEPRALELVKPNPVCNVCGEEGCAHLSPPDIERETGRGMVCSVCKDTHLMDHYENGSDYAERQVPCTSCPVPCQECRAGGKGAYCEKTPCDCGCHEPEEE